VPALRVVLAAVAIGCLGACAGGSLRDEPADLIAPGRTIPQLVALGWQIGDPVAAADVEDRERLAAYAPWLDFKAAIRPGDELRPILHNAGKGYARFRGGRHVDELLLTIF
jgi:hypothetical protein